MDITVTIWDWEPVWGDVPSFRRFVTDMARLGATGIEMGVPWHSTEPSPGAYDWQPVLERLDVIAETGLTVRVRLNQQDPPSWHHPVWAQTPDGAPFVKGYGQPPKLLPSLFDEDHVSRAVAWTAAAASALAGHGIEYSLGCGLHFELKHGAWTGYEPCARAVFGVAAPDLDLCLNRPADPRVVRWVDVRARRLRDVAERLAAAVRAGDPLARLSAPLGEGFRAESAEFANQDITGLSAHADAVVFSYDFFIHGPEETWHLDALTRVYRSLTGRPVVLEIDGTATGVYQRYGVDGLARVAKVAANAGAVGMNLANYAGPDDPDHRALSALVPRVRELDVSPIEDRPTAWLLLTPWSYYLDRSSTQDTHTQQLGLLARLDEIAPMGPEQLSRMAPHRGAPLILPPATAIDTATRRLLEGSTGWRLFTIDDQPLRVVDPTTGEIAPWRPRAERFQPDRVCPSR